MVLEQVDPLDDLRVADDEAEPPARHPVRLRHREELDPDLLRAGRGEEALRRAPVEDEVAVGEVVDDVGAVVARPPGEDAFRRDDGAGVRGVVQVERTSRCARELRPGRRERPSVASASATRGEVVRVAGVGEQDGVAALREHEAELDERGLRARHDGDLARGVELHAVDVAVARGDRLLQLRHARGTGVPVRAVVRGRALSRLDHVRGRPDLGVAAAEVDERLAVLRRLRRDAREQRGEVLLRQSLEARGSL